MHTESEAARLWCPMIRHDSSLGDDAAAVNVRASSPLRDGGDFEGYTCKAKRCAMWRWVEREGSATTRLGYCGLGGRP